MLSTGLALLAMALLMQWSLGRGFLDYIDQTEQARLDGLTTVMARRYEQAGGSWDWTQKPREWRRLTSDRPNRGPGARPRSERNDSPRPPREWRPPPDDFPRGGPRRPPPPNGSGPRGPRPPPPRRGNRPGPGPLSIGPRLTLFDANQTRIIGAPQTFSEASHIRFIKVNKAVVGWLSLQRIEQISALRDVSFLQRQRNELIAIAFALLSVSVLLAFFFARQLTRPLTALTALVRRLTQGDYQTPAARLGADEVAALSRDINALAKTLDENQQARQRWIADISHELRTPLAILRGELEAIKDGVRQFDRTTVDSVHAEVMNLGKLVDDLHDLSLSDAGALSYRMLAMDLGKVLDEAVEMFRQRIASHRLSLSYTRAAGAKLMIMGDRQRLLQLLVNLLENSLRYTDTGGQLAIRIAQHSGSVVIEITDSEPSVTAAECERLFERLYRVEQSRNRAKGGSGLGLAICQDITQAHNGTINAQPSALGGIAITLELPKLTQESP